MGYRKGTSNIPERPEDIHPIRTILNTFLNIDAFLSFSSEANITLKHFDFNLNSRENHSTARA
jgi:hypothetical protein